MKIYCLGLNANLLALEEIKVKDVRFAFFSALGTWGSERPACQVCGYHWQVKVPPLKLQWEPSTSLIGDFSWDGPYGYTFVVQEHIASKLADMRFLCNFYSVEYVKPKAKRNTVSFPYTGPKLVWCDCSASVSLDVNASNVRLESSCASCGDVRYTFKNNGIVIRRSEWHGKDMFRIITNGRSDATFVTEEGRRMIEEAKFSNVSFMESGIIID